MTAADPSDVVRTTMLALGRGDLDGFLAGLHEDVEWHGSGVLLPVGLWRGRDAVLAGLHENSARRGRPVRVVLREVASREDTVLLLGVIVLEDAHGRTNVPNSWVVEVRDGLVERVTAYLSDSLARNAWTARS